jgi:Na+:H+ antiporter, NhaA family
MTPRPDRHAKLKGALAFFQHEAAGGVVLVAAAAVALIVSNSPLEPLYERLLDTPVGVHAGPLALEKPLLLWINDGLMAVFFFLVGLELKRELLRGELSTFGQAVLPALAAVGGMAVPALIYVACNAGNPVALRGWAIPSATDIAFAVGVLALLGPRIPPSLKVFLLALAILDDLGAILIIALFYTADLHWVSLLLAGLGATLLLALNRRGVTRLAPYLLTGVFIWVCVLKSGVHATLAGVVVAIAIPIGAAPGTRTAGGSTLIEQLEEALHPWVAFAILPLFAFANAGVSLQGLSLAKLAEPVPLGIALGLFLGKPLGIFAATWLAVAARLAPRLQGASWAQILGVGMLGGIGFTMSLFIGMLAFSEPAHAAQLRLGVLSGSLLSALAGFLVLRFSAPGRPGSRG